MQYLLSLSRNTTSALPEPQQPGPDQVLYQVTPVQLHHKGLPYQSLPPVRLAPASSILDDKAADESNPGILSGGIDDSQIHTPGLNSGGARATIFTGT